MALGHMNVLVYSGTGSAVDSVRHCLYTLRQLLGHNHAVIPVSGDQIIQEPWLSSCAAVVFPGGADQGYCRTLNGEGNRRIRRFVEAGGAYLGFCAGGYYGSGRCEFEVGNRVLEVIGDRELAFFPGIDRGGAFAGFVYNSEKGARATELQVDKTALPLGSVPNVFSSYYNGGGVFVDAAKHHDRGVEVLASYTETLAVDAGKDAAAVVYCKVGQGAALLTGPHPEFVFFRKPADDWSLTRPRFAAANLEKKQDSPGFDKVVDVLARDEKHRTDFMKACLMKLGLKVTEEQTVPSLSCIHLSSLQASSTSELLASLEDIATTEEGEKYIKDDNDTFHIVKHSAWSLGNLYSALTSTLEQKGKTDYGADSAGDSTTIVDYSSIIKEILAHETDHPAFEQTPYFSHHSYYSNLSKFQRSTPQAKSQFGMHLLYGEVVTSTNTLLEKNTQLLRQLPTGFTAVATCQLAGRGRGSNVWVSPPGSLMFSIVMHHPMALMQQAPVVFVQYLAALAIVEGVKFYDGDLYKDMPIKIKWPNDIYALDPEKVSTPDIKNTPHGNSKTHKHNTTSSTNGDRDQDKYVKIGGILVNSHYNTQDYIAVCGIGLNLSNNLPTTSLNALLPLLQKQRSSPPNPSTTNTNTTTTETVTTKTPTSSPSPLPPFTPERLLPSILTSFDALYTRFLRMGFDDSFLNKYHEHWLHGGQVITLEAEGGLKARINSISADHGLLVVEELEKDRDGNGAADDDDDNDSRPWKGTGRMWKLQSDSNSFDFFHGLIRRKM